MRCDIHLPGIVRERKAANDYSKIAEVTKNTDIDTVLISTVIRGYFVPLCIFYIAQKICDLVATKFLLRDRLHTCRPKIGINFRLLGEFHVSCRKSVDQNNPCMGLLWSTFV